MRYWGGVMREEGIDDDVGEKRLEKKGKVEKLVKKYLNLFQWIDFNYFNDFRYKIHMF